VGSDRRDRPAAPRDADLGTRLRLLADRLPLALWVWETPPDGDPRSARLLVANEAAVRLRGRPGVETSPGTEARDLGASEAELAEFARVLALAGTDVTLDLGTSERVVAGRPVIVRRVAFGLDERTVGVVVEDVTRPVVAERGRAALLDRLLVVADHERRWLADALHDDTIQRLAAVVLSLDALAARDEGPAAATVVALAVDIRDAIGQLRSLIFELAPPEVDADGLAAAVARTAHHLFGDGPPEVTIDIALPDTTAAAVTGVLYRVLVEALVNVAKHARASHVGVRVSVEDELVRAVVVDDGVGAGAASGERSDPGHLGVRSMRDRCEQLGGSFRLLAGSDGGTVVEARFPLTRSVEGDAGTRRPPAPDWRPPEVRERRTAPDDPRFERLVVPTPDLVACYSADLRVHYVNREFGRRLGRICLELIGRPIADVFPPGAARSATTSVARVLRNGRPDRYVVDDPEWAPGGLDVLVVPDLDPQGRAVRVWAWLREMRPPDPALPVTFPVAAVPSRPGEVDDARPPGRVAQFLRVTPDFVACLDRSGAFTWANESLLHFLEQPLASIVHRSPAEVGLPRRPAFDAALSAVVDTGVPHRTSVPLADDEGVRVDVLLTPQFPLDDSGTDPPASPPERVWLVGRPMA
jgi:signal transduction histidine kinase